MRIHADFCGPINGLMYLIITDAYSKWVDIKEMSNIVATSTIEMLKEYFSEWGLPNTLVPIMDRPSRRPHLKDSWKKIA